MMPLNGFSAHARQSVLSNGCSSLATTNPKEAITNGDEKQQGYSIDLLKKKFGVKTMLPKSNEIVEL